MKKLLIFLFSAATVISACKKYNEEFTGAPLGIAPDDFAVVNNSFAVSKNNPNFINDTIYFMATFNASVTWKIRLKGELSGAIKIISGYSNSINANNSKWNGTTDIAKLFRGGENVNASLTVYGWTDSLTTTINIVLPKKHGTILGRFENIVPDGAGNFTDQGLYWFSSFDANEKEFMNKVLDADAPEGNYCIQLKGHDANGNYYIGKAGLSSSSPFTFAFGSSDANKVYFNLYVKGEGAGSVAKLVIETFEDDNDDHVVYYDNSEDKYSSTIDLGFDGWKLISIKYSDFVLESSSSPYKDKNPDKIHLIGFYCGPKSASATSLQVQFDFPTVTVDAPMIP